MSEKSPLPLGEKGTNTTVKTLVGTILVALAILILDQWSKALVINQLQQGKLVPVIDGFFYFKSKLNSGAAFGILKDQIWLFVSIAVIVTVVSIYLLPKWSKTQPGMAWSLSLILGGGLGNMIDRIRFESVVDFFYFIFFDLITSPIFNVADIAISAGFVSLVWQLWRQEKKHG